MPKDFHPRLKERTPFEKLVWLYLHDHPGEYSTTQLSDALGTVRQRTSDVLNRLIENGLVVVVVPRTNRTAGQYRAATWEEMDAWTPPRAKRGRKKKEVTA